MCKFRSNLRQMPCLLFNPGWYGPPPYVSEYGPLTACMEKGKDDEWVVAVVYGQPRGSIRRGNRTPFCLHGRSPPGLVAWYSRELCRDRAVRDVIYWSLSPGNIPIRASILPRHSRQVRTISIKKNVNVITAVIEQADVPTIADSATPIEEDYFCCVARQSTVPAYSQAVVLVTFRGAGLMRIENHWRIVEHRCSKTAQGLMDLLHGKPLYVFIANLPAKLVNLTKFMIIATVPNAPSCTIHALDEDPCTMEKRDQPSTQCPPAISRHIIHYKPPEGWNEPLDKHNAVNE